MTTTFPIGATRTVGTSVLRVEDLRILTGRGRYVDDKALAGTLHAAFLRSPFPHARVLGVDTSAAAEAPGVVAVYTGTELAQKTTALTPLAAPPTYLHEPVKALADDKVRFVGDPVALVIAESRALAEDACELIVVDYDPIEAIATYDQALRPDGPLVFESLGTNVIYEITPSFGEVDQAFAEADLVVRHTVAQHRVAQVPMEGRGGVAAYDPASGELVFYGGTQSPHAVRGYIAQYLGLPLDQVRVVNGDIGGAFGLKLSVGREELAICAASMWLGRPVKWIEDRSEHLLASGQAREEKVEMEAAVRRDGTILGLRCDLVLDAGAYVGLPFPGGSIVGLVANMLPGPYALRGLAVRARVVASNKCSYSAYRGPWAVETFARERMLNVVASELGLDPADVRRANFAPNDGTAKMLSGLSLEGTSSAQSLERALELSDYEAFRKTQALAREQGRYLGIGFATFIEAAPGPAAGRGMHERSVAHLDDDGGLSVFTTQAPHGQSHETTLAQIAADEMGIGIERVRIHHGDTASTPYAMMGTGGSRAATMASGSVLHSTRKVKEQVLALAAALLEVGPEDLVVEDGVVHPAGVPSVSLTLADVARRARELGDDELPEGVDRSLEAEADYDGGLGGWSGGTHLATVEVDLGTGRVTLLRYQVVEDCGKMVNPAVVEGQIRGGVAQGVGEVFYEHSAYDEQGNYLAATFMDYLLPTASEVPVIEIDHLENVPNEEVSYRGVGEGGMLVSPATLVNAVEDALAPFQARISYQYLPPHRILELARVIPTDPE